MNEILNTEYLIILDKRNDKALYDMIDSNERFLEFLSKSFSCDIDNISNIIYYLEEQFFFNIKNGAVKGVEQRFFFISVSSDWNDIGDFIKYRKLLKCVRGACRENGFIVEVVKDDLSYYYSCKAYSEIHKVENLMRRFISYFMITNVGKGWEQKNSPKDVAKRFKEERDNNGKEFASQLHKLDFGHLGSILFDSYQFSDNANLFKEIIDNKDSEKVEIAKLLKYMPISNWEKFFKEEAGCDASFLKTRWDKLEKLRNRVAHSADISEDEYNQIHESVNEVIPVISKAFDNLDSVELDNESKINFQNKIAVTLSEKLSEVFDEINEITSDISFKYDGDINSFPVELQDRLDKVEKLKNKLALEVYPSDKNMEKIRGEMDELKNGINNTWNIDVFRVMEKSNSPLSLNDIYEKFKASTDRDLPPSWKSSVRKAIYHNSSDVDLFNGKFDFYKRLNKGEWVVRGDIDEEMVKKFLGKD